jgi:methyl-accepting chemotaxis protein
MRWLSDLRVRTKLLGSFLVICAILVGAGYLGVTTAQGIKAHLDTVSLNLLPSAVALADTQANLIRAQRDIRSAVLVDDQREIDEFVQKFKQEAATAEAAFAAYQALPMSDEERRLVTEFLAAFRTWRGVNEQAAAAAAKNTPADNRVAIELLMKQGAPLATSMNAVIDRLATLQETQAAAATQAAQEQYDSAVRLLLVSVGIGLVLALGIAILLTRVITTAVAGVATAARRIGQEDLPALARVAQALADGDLTQTATVSAQRVAVQGRDELGEMAADFNAMVDRLQETGAAFGTMTANLRDVIGQVKGSADGVADTSGQLGQAATQTSGVVQQVTVAIQNVASGAQETSRSAQNSNEAVDQLSQAIDSIARGAADQARQVQVAASTTTQMAASIEQVAENAQTVAAASQQTRASAEQGAQAVRETVEGMQEIKAVVNTAAAKVEELGRLGEKIGAVVETIDDIAEQTNLLALNAAIEAARAGEHGRGFAVVADEVRKLAERSQRETKAISELIREVQSGTKDAVTAMAVGSHKVEQGTLKADQAGTSLSEILRAVEATVGQVSGIAAAANEVATGARSVVDTMSSISAVVEENSAATEEMAAQAGQVTGAIQSIAAVSEENSAATEEVSASAEEMSAQVEEMNAQAEELAATAEQLKSLVARFTLEVSDSSQGVAPISRRRASDWSNAPASPVARRSA